MHNAQIIVTVNPSDWEGDFRLWESMATGALVFVDPIFAPHPFPLVHGEHIIMFSNMNKTDLWDKLDYYRANPQEARKIAVNGYLHAMKHHRTVSMIDYVMRSAHIKRTAHFGEEVPRYTYSAQYLFRETMVQKNKMIKEQTPGVFQAIPFRTP
jgi:spore maturation protein CgeB